MRELPEFEKVIEFTEYCKEFYCVDQEGAIYPFAYDFEIVGAVNAHCTDPNPAFPFDGDTADREAVRDRICANRKLVGVFEHDFDTAVREVREQNERMANQ